MSRTERDTTSSVVRPDITSPNCGPADTRPREGLSPTRPQHEAGMRIEPPPSLAWASVTIPAATAAAAPPLEPPLERPGSQGLRVAPWASGSVVGRIPSSGVFVRPTITKPASRKRRASQVSSDSIQSRSRRKAMPSCIGSPAVWQARSLTRKGTPRNGPSAGSLASAFSKSGWITAFSSPSRASMRAMAASISSRGEASPERTSSACAVASTTAGPYSRRVIAETRSDFGTFTRWNPSRLPRTGTRSLARSKTPR